MQKDSTMFAECDTMKREAMRALCAEFLQLSSPEKELALQHIREIKARKEISDVR